MHLSPQAVLDKRKAHILPCLGHFYQDPPHFVRGHMQYLYDVDGREYLDFFAGVSVMNCGHSNPAIIEPVTKQIQNLQHVCNIYLTQGVADLAERLGAVLPGNLSHSFFCNSGSEAMDGAMVLARSVTKRRKFIALVGGLHGRTQLTQSVTGIDMWRTDPFLSEESVFFIDIAGDYDQALAQLQVLLTDHGQDIAAFIAEPIQGNAGIVTPPADFFTKVRELLAPHGVLMIMDEVQTGFGRCGSMFACERYNVVPDIMAYAKALGNGFPLAGFSTTAELAAQFTKPSASTLGGNPVSATAGLAVLDYLQTQDLPVRSRELGGYLQAGLIALQKKHPCITEVRGMGLMLGAEIVTATGEPAPHIVDTVLERLKDQGIIIGRNGLARNVLAFQPPLIIERADIERVLTALDEVLGALDAIPASS